MTGLVVDLQSLQGQDLERGIPRWTAEFLREIRRQGVTVHGVINPILDAVPSRFNDCFNDIDENSRSHLRSLSEFGNLVYLCPSAFEPVRPIRSLLPSHVVDSRIPVTAVIHDLTNYLFPNHYQVRRGDDRLFSARRHLFSRLDAYLAISRSTAADLIRQWSVPAERVTVVGTGVSPKFSRGDIDGQRLRQLGITKPFVHCVGRADPRKRTPLLIRAFAGLDQALRGGHQLVITCRVTEDVKRSWLELARTVGLADDAVVVTGIVDDDLLRMLYSSCALFVEPSEYEGFGLPAAEAAACGAPVIVPNVSSLPEILELPEATFDSASVESLIGAIACGLTDDEFRSRLQRAGRTVPLRHNWSLVAQRAIEVFDRLARPISVVSANTVYPVEAFGRTIARGEVEVPTENRPATEDEVPRRLRLGIYNRFWATMGGGEQHAGAAAVALASKYDVELIGIEDFDRTRFAKLLGRPEVANLPLRIVSQEPTAVARASADYDVFVNHSYTSEDMCLAPHGLYVVFFPQNYNGSTANDNTTVKLVAGPDWSASGDVRDQLRLSSGGILNLDAQVPDSLTFVADGAGSINVTTPREQWREEIVGDRRLVTLRLPKGRSTISYVSTTGDSLVISSPQTGSGQRLFGGEAESSAPPAFVTSYQRVLGNSDYTSEWIRRRWSADAVTHYPPVDLRAPSANKENRILSVGRFFSEDNNGHCKQQLRLVRAFKKMLDCGLVGWRLVLVGGVDRAFRDYALAVRREAAGLPVDVLLNADFATLNEELARASIYWHATGFGVDLDRFPERAEHFGIAPVEAMSTGAIPILYAAGGPREVVREGVEGFLFSAEDELIAKTLSVMNMAESERGAFRTAAINRAQDFSGERFASELLRHVEDILEIDTSTRPVFAHE